MGQMTSRLVPTWKAGPADSPTTWGRQQGFRRNRMVIRPTTLTLGRQLLNPGPGLALPCSTSIALAVES